MHHKLVVSIVSMNSNPQKEIEEYVVTTLADFRYFLIFVGVKVTIYVCVYIYICTWYVLPHLDTGLTIPNDKYIS